MGSIVLLLAGGLCSVPPPIGEIKTPKLRYVRPAKQGWALECWVTQRRDANGTVHVSHTERDKEKMTLTVRRDSEGNFLSAETVHQVGTKKKKATLTQGKKDATLLREGGIAERVSVPPDAVVTTTPDWTDIFEVVRRYDRKKGGKQEFPGLWFHPAAPHRALTFTAEKLGTDTVDVSGAKTQLDRYRVDLRSGGYVVWADGGGRVVKFIPEGRPEAAVVLAGFEETTKALK